MKIVWRDGAERDLEQIVAYIAARNPDAAFAMFERIVRLTDRLLPDNPGMGRSIGAGLRELVVQRSYIVTYRLTGTEIQILAVRHSARR